ncbi:MAG: hypothetical protein PHT95_06195 [Candidatus Omnitrophica bacterium]|nr:hypothetical protein [Candidatus Omnitrophota bacterium]
MGYNTGHKKTLQDGFVMFDHSRNSAVVMVAAIVILMLFSAEAGAGFNTEDGPMSLGLPVGRGGEAADLSICPQGARVVDMFLAAWGRKDYQAMYALIDDPAKDDYSFEDAKFDFQFMEYRDYKISSIRRSGDDFEFILGSGDWRDGDKDTRKMMISGKTYKVLMPSRGTFFKASADGFFNERSSSSKPGILERLR